MNQAKKKPAAPGNAAGLRRHEPTTAHDGAIVAQQHDAGKLALVIRKGEARIDSRVLAQHFGKDHHDVFELVKNYQADFEQLGIVRFQTEKTSPGRGRPERFALLTEDQAYLLLTYSRNTARARALKIKLIQAFGEARRAAVLHGAEYLPTYHALHEQIHALAAGSSNEKFVHLNVNRLINQAAGIEAGQRAGASFPVQSLLVVAQAMQRAPNHRAGFQRAKSALADLSRAVLIEGGAA